MADHDVPDSTDWLSTPLSGLAAVENALRCEVCKDFYKTPMMTTCSHTFCSLCIRRALSNDGKCPMCRSSDQQLKLRSNWAMEETVDAFTKARAEALELARSSREEKIAPKRKADDEPVKTNDAPESKRLRTSARLRKNQPAAPPPEPIEIEEDEVEELPEEDEYVPDDGLVPCPVCQSRMKEWQVFSHLESCTGPAPPKPKAPQPPVFSQRQAQHTKASERLSGLNYAMLKDNALKKKMGELGISTQGPRVLLERRHKEWLTIWNANCDAVRPRKRSELMHDLDVWERTQGGRVSTAGGRMTQNEPMVKDKDFDGAAWSSKHSSSFQDLVANARKSRMEAKKKAEDAERESAEEAAREAATTVTSSATYTTGTSNLGTSATNGNSPTAFRSSPHTIEQQEATASSEDRGQQLPNGVLQPGLPPGVYPTGETHVPSADGLEYQSVRVTAAKDWYSHEPPTDQLDSRTQLDSRWNDSRENLAPSSSSQGPLHQQQPNSGQ